MKTLCLYSPYFPKHLGGGEKHLLDVALVLAKKYSVVIAIPQPEFPTAQSAERALRKRFEQAFGRSLSEIKFIATPLGTEASAIQKLLWTKIFDGIYYVTDGSLFFSLAAKNFLHIQIPFTQPKKSVVERLKLANWQHKNTNSEFTKRFVTEAWQTHIDTVMYPLVETAEFAKSVKKERTIISIGRFFTQLHAKRQDILIEQFAKLQQQKQFKDWKLQLIGTIEDQAYFSELKRSAKGLPVQFITNADRKQIVSLLQTARLYWHAAGFEIDETQHPEKVEHFGMSVAEALAAGAIPIVVGKGGVPEVLGTELSRLFWERTEQLVRISTTIVSDPKQEEQLRAACKKRAEHFSAARFSERVLSQIKL